MSVFLFYVFSCKKRDVEEGADMLMVKPGLAYLDMVKELQQNVRHF